MPHLNVTVPFHEFYFCIVVVEAPAARADTKSDIDKAMISTLLIVSVRGSKDAV
jgi:hypothetical protein